MYPSNSGVLFRHPDLVDTKKPRKRQRFDTLASGPALHKKRSGSVIGTSAGQPRTWCGQAPDRGGQSGYLSFLPIETHAYGYYEIDATENFQHFRDEKNRLPSPPLPLGEGQGVRAILGGRSFATLLPLPRVSASPSSLMLNGVTLTCRRLRGS